MMRLLRAGLDSNQRGGLCEGPALPLDHRPDQSQTFAIEMFGFFNSNENSFLQPKFRPGNVHLCG